MFDEVYGCAAKRSLSLWHQSPAPPAFCLLLRRGQCQRAGAMDWYIYRHGPCDKRGLFPASIGLGVAGTLGPEGQVAFSCGRPIFAAPTALADDRGGGA
jgi:hypothetical protein